MTRGELAVGTSQADLALGLVGAGPWGSRYVASLSGLEGVHLALVASRSPAARERVPAGCEFTTDWRGAVSNGKLDGVVLATPPAVHHDMVMACLASGLPVLVEKPLTLDGQAARALRDAASRSGSLVMVDHTHVFSSAFEALKARARRLEPPLRVRSIGGNRGPYRKDVNGLWDYGPHDVSMCLDLVGEEPVAVHGEVASLAGPDARGMAVEARLAFPGGARASLTFGNGLKEKRRVFEVQAANGALLYDDLAEAKLIERDHRGRGQAVRISPVPPLTRAVLAFCDAIVSGRRQDPSLYLGVAVVETLERIAASIPAASCPAPR